MWRKYRETRKPEAVAVCFDRYEKTFREEMDANYKAQRQAMPDDLVPQIDDAKRACRLLGLAVVEEAGYEADDLIGSIAVAASGAGLRVEIASADKDLFQLVKDPAVSVWHPVQERLLDEAGVTEFFGVPPDRVLDVLALMGDSSDNIPGVRGIGEKTAKELVTTFGSLDAIYARLDEVKGKRKETLANGREDALRSRTLATVLCDRPLPAAPGNLLEHFRIRPLTDEGTGALATFYDEMGFAKLKKELLESRPADPAKAAPARRPGPRNALSLRRGGLDGRCSGQRPMGSVGGGSRGARRVRPEGRPRGRPRGVRSRCAVARAPARGGRGRSGGRDRRLLSRSSPDGRERERSRRSFRTFSSWPTTRRGSFWRPTRSGSRRPGASWTRCSRATSSRPGFTRTTSPGDARGILDLPPEAVPPLKDLAGGAPVTRDALASEAGRKWLVPRVRLPLALLETLAPRLAEGSALRRVLDEIELPLIPVLARMEIAGVAVDRGVLAEMSKEFDGRLAALEGRIHEAAGEPFNIGSPAQLGRILFEKLLYPAVKKTAKTKSWATDSDVLEELAALSTGPVPGLVLEWREISKLKGTYVDALPLAIAGGRAHPHALRPGRRRDGAPLLERAEPPEHPRPHGGRPRDSPGLRRAARPRSRGRGLFPDRAPPPRAPVGGRGAPRDVPARGGHPPRDGGEDLRRSARRRDAGSAPRREDDQLRRPLRHGPVRARDAARRARARRRRSSSPPTSRGSRGSARVSTRSSRRPARRAAPRRSSGACGPSPASTTGITTCARTPSGWR